MHSKDLLYNRVNMNMKVRDLLRDILRLIHKLPDKDLYIYYLHMLCFYHSPYSRCILVYIHYKDLQNIR